MRYIVMIIATGIFLSSCKNNNLAPDVSKIPVVLSTERYEKDFFSLDSATLQEGLKKSKGARNKKQDPCLPP
ncbi:MAG TPA: hypothetical protein PLU18_10545, partial [Ferruginibacter sp.]|nr:hypothetical protein [Ferruginibacter sp.]